MTERKHAEDALRDANNKLESRVRERTGELEEANNELEAFSYSVSHDLRAPLRSLDGFSHALLEDHADKLDEEGVGFLQRIRADSQRMAELIDDLLRLSRVTRTEMRNDAVDLSLLAHATSTNLQQIAPEREVTFVIAEGLVAKGDQGLLGNLLENLLGNAWKYTEKRERARVEFGCNQENGSRVYFVRDDGVGFNMEYVDKLYHPFQRLHTVDEFEGAGIGLAIVQRIVHRHNGRTWAESEPDQGATFYFTLN